MKFYSADWTKLLLHIYDKDARLIGTKDLNIPSKLTDEDKVGIICSGISRGESVTKLATGQNGRLTKERFFLLIQSKSDFKAMYLDALQRRIYTLTENLVALTDEAVIKRQHTLIKSLIGIFNEERSGSSRYEKVQFNTFLSPEKLESLQRKDKRVERGGVS